jgi:hypothetical protein
MNKNVLLCFFGLLLIGFVSAQNTLIVPNKFGGAGLPKITHVYFTNYSFYETENPPINTGITKGSTVAWSQFYNYNYNIDSAATDYAKPLKFKVLKYTVEVLGSNFYQPAACEGYTALKRGTLWFSALSGRPKQYGAAVYCSTLQKNWIKFVRGSAVVAYNDGSGWKKIPNTPYFLTLHLNVGGKTSNFYNAPLPFCLSDSCPSK